MYFREIPSQNAINKNLHFTTLFRFRRFSICGNPSNIFLPLCPIPMFATFHSEIDQGDTITTKNYVSDYFLSPKEPNKKRNKYFEAEKKLYAICHIPKQFTSRMADITCRRILNPDYSNGRKHLDPIESGPEDWLDSLPTDAGTTYRRYLPVCHEIRTGTIDHDFRISVWPGELRRRQSYNCRRCRLYKRLHTIDTAHPNRHTIHKFYRILEI